MSNNLTPTENLNNRCRDLIGYTLEELLSKVNEQVVEHKEQLVNYLEQSSEIKAYIDTYRYEVALPFAVIDIDTLCHNEKRDSEYEKAHEKYCPLFKDYTHKFFVWENIEKYLQSLNDTKSRIIYLTSLKLKVEATDWRWFRYYDPETKLILNCNLEITKLESQLTSDQNKEVEPLKNEDISLRRKVLALMLLTFGRLDLPEDITNERVIEFFHGITGGSRKNLSDKIANPTAHKGTTRSIKLLCDDLNFVRDQLGKLGLSDNITAAINEINYLIEDLKEKDN